MNNAIIDAPRNYMIRNVQLNWAHLDKPLNPFGKEQYEMQIATTDKKVADEWSANYLKVKEKEGVYSVGLTRKVLQYKGEPNGKVKVVTSDLKPLPEGVMIGNGSIGNVKIYQRPYNDIAGSSGTSNSLTAVQVTSLIVYEGNPDDNFVVIEESGTPTKTDSVVLDEEDILF